MLLLNRKAVHTKTITVIGMQYKTARYTYNKHAQTPTILPSE